MVSILTIAVSACGKEDAGQQSSPGNALAVVATANSDSNSANQWINGWRDASALQGPRAGAATVIVNGYIYVIGGVNGIDFVRLTEYAKINDDGSLGNGLPLIGGARGGIGCNYSGSDNDSSIAFVCGK